MKSGVLIANIGTPDRPEPKEVKRYLKAFLGDKRVIDKPRWMWLPILHGIILQTRPKKSAALYREIWQEEGPPLLIHTRHQMTKLQRLLPDHVVKYGMAYSQPTISEALAAFSAENVQDVTIIPMYPQYSTTTTAAINDVVFRHYLSQENMPTLHTIRDFHQHPRYIALLRRQITEYLNKHTPDKLIISYHGIPVSYVKKGDPYYHECQATTQALFDGWECPVPYQVAYQSRFGPDEWLTPALDETLKTLPHQGVKKVVVITPGFVSDCVETLEEIEDENYHYFMENGGEQFDYIHPFNDDDDFIALLAALVQSKNG